MPKNQLRSPESLLGDIKDLRGNIQIALLLIDEILECEAIDFNLLSHQEIIYLPIKNRDLIELLDEIHQDEDRFSAISVGLNELAAVEHLDFDLDRNYKYGEVPGQAKYVVGIHAFRKQTDDDEDEWRTHEPGIFVQLHKFFRARNYEESGMVRESRVQLGVLDLN